jgi:hypothetical protein
MTVVKQNLLDTAERILFLCLFGAGEGKQSRLPKRFESEQN